MKDDELLHKWIEGTISADELKVFQLRPEYESLVDLYKNSEHLAAPSFDKKEMLQTILKEKKGIKTSAEKPKEAKQFRLPNWSKLAIAASLLALVAVFMWPGTGGMKSFATAIGETKTERLPDGSVFILNAESELSFNAKEWSETRKVVLSGEAYFEVEKGKKFTVYTEIGNVEVLGTRFNVWSRGKLMDVSCQEGRVAVSNAAGETQGVLKENDALRIDALKGLERWKTPAAEKADWVNGLFKFRKVPMSRVLDELERQFNVQIDANDVNIEEIISCNFQAADLELALKTTLTPLGVRYKIESDKKITLFKYTE